MAIYQSTQESRLNSINAKYLIALLVTVLLAIYLFLFINSPTIDYKRRLSSDVGYLFEELTQHIEANDRVDIESAIGAIYCKLYCDEDGRISNKSRRVSLLYDKDYNSWTTTADRSNDRFVLVIKEKIDNIEVYIAVSKNGTKHDLIERDQASVLNRMSSIGKLYWD